MLHRRLTQRICPGWLAAGLLVPWLGLTAAQAEPKLSLPVECQLALGPWQPCTLTIEQVGEHWWLQVGSQTLVFRSNGRGEITLRDPAGITKTVQPVWTAQRALCWDGVCTKGDFPLD